MSVKWVEVAERNNRDSPFFSCCPVNREYSWKKTQIEKKRLRAFNFGFGHKNWTYQDVQKTSWTQIRRLCPGYLRSSYFRLHGIGQLIYFTLIDIYFILHVFSISHVNVHVGKIPEIQFIGNGWRKLFNGTFESYEHLLKEDIRLLLIMFLRPARDILFVLVHVGAFVLHFMLFAVFLTLVVYISNHFLLEEIYCNQTEIIRKVLIRKE